MYDTLKICRRSLPLKAMAILALTATFVLTATAYAASFVYVTVTRQHIGDDPGTFDGEGDYRLRTHTMTFSLPDNVDTSKTALLMLRAKDVDHYGCNIFINATPNSGLDFLVGSLETHPNASKHEWFSQIIEIPANRLKAGVNTLKINSTPNSDSDWDDFMVDSIVVFYR